MPVKLEIGKGSEIFINSSRGLIKQVIYYVPEQNFSGSVEGCAFTDMIDVSYDPEPPVSTPLRGFRFAGAFRLKYDTPTTFFIYEDPETGDEYICDIGGKERLELLEI